MAMAIPIAMLVIAAGSAAMAYKEKKDIKAENQRAQDEYNARMKEQTLEQMKEVNVAKGNALENESKDKLQNDLDYLKARSTSRNFGGALGARGQSFDLVMQSIDQQYQQSAADIQAGKRETIRDLDKQGDNILRGGENVLDNRVISKPSIMGATANAVSQGYKGYQAGQSVRESYNEWRA